MVAFGIQFVILATVCNLGIMAQRPSYAGSNPIGFPDLHSRFRDTTESSTAATPLDLNNRVGQDTSTSTVRTPVDARGDQQLVNRLNEWPREHRPFWLLNAEAIEASRQQFPQPQPPQPQQQQRRQNVQNRNNFASVENEELSAQEPETIPIRPINQRSSFLRPIE